MGRRRDKLPKQVATQLRNDKMLLLLIQRGECEPLRYRGSVALMNKMADKFEASGYTVTREAG